MSEVPKDLINREQNERIPITDEEAWDVVYWSFELSRGNAELQRGILEYMQRNYAAPEFTKDNTVPDVLINQVIKKLHTQRHALRYRPEKHETSLRIRVNDELFRYRRQLNQNQRGIVHSTESINFIALQEESLLKKIAELIEVLDVHWEQTKQPTAPENHGTIYRYIVRGQRFPNKYIQELIGRVRPYIGANDL